MGTEKVPKVKISLKFEKEQQTKYKTRQKKYQWITCYYLAIKKSMTVRCSLAVPGCLPPLEVQANFDKKNVDQQRIAQISAK